jgi:predicted TIM-barrel fold metal-dependent hydrolase
MTGSAHTLPVIDVHVHIRPEAAETWLQVMQANNLSRVVNLGMIERLGLPYAEGVRAFGERLGQRLVHFATPDFSDTAPGFGARLAGELERKAQAGARGLKIFKELGLRHKDAAGNLIPVDDARLDPLWAKAGELGLPVLMHTADPLAFFRPLDAHNERRDELQTHPDWHFGTPAFPDHDTLLDQRNRVIARHPHTTFIGAHLGNYPENLSYVDGCLESCTNFCVETSARIGEFGRHPVEEVREFFFKHQDRVLFGTDLGVRSADLDDVARYTAIYDTHWRYFETDERQIPYPGYPIQGRWKVDAIGLPVEILEKLYYRNAERLIPALRG